jgi:DEAD/DEAH box helicase domain-containing protein
MNPILLGRQVERGLKDLVRATLNTTSPAFEGTIERFLTEPANYVKGPWISVAMPFRQSVAPGEPFDQPFPLVPLRFAPYQHQLSAFGRLSGSNPRSTLVATGTGSGKTESYLWPILDHCRANKGKPGVKAILIYPMNALATDQARRIARAINGIPALNGVRAGIYADAEPKAASDGMTEEDVITRRAAMWANPPDILLTNYKMLDYLLLRARDQPLWSQNAPETLRFLVVDEMHTFDGAQGADLALLIRRLKHRLGTPDKHLTCVGSSATLGSGEEAATELRAYANTIFGEAFDESSVIRETRLTPREIFRDPEYTDWPEPSELAAALEAATEMSQAGAAQHLAICLFPSSTDPDVLSLREGDPSSILWRLLLGRVLLEHLAVQRVLRVIAEHPGPASLSAIATGLGAVKALTAWSQEDRMRLAELIVSLVAWARAGSEGSLQPVYGVRIQLWVREMSRMVAKLPRWTAEGRRTEIELLHAHDLDLHELRNILPIVNCNRCGTAAHLAKQSPRGMSVWAPLPELYEEFFEGGSSRMRLIYHESVSRKAGTSGRGGVIAGLVDAESIEFTPGDHGENLEPGSKCPAWLYDPTDDQGEFDRTCPACGHAHGLLLFGLRAARLTAALANTLYASEQNEVEPQAKPRFLMFSDSVQDAAQRAAVAEIRNSAAVIRKSLFQAIAASPSRSLTLEEAITSVPEAFRQKLGNETFVATFIARNQTWRDPYQKLLMTNRVPSDDRFLDHVKLRLGWEYFSDLTYRSHTSQTLEAAGLAIAEVSPKLIRAVAATLPRQLANALSGGFEIDEISARRFLHGLLQQMRRRGAVGHPYVVEGMVASPIPRGGPNYFAAARAMGLRNTDALPIPNFRTGAAPLPVTLMRNVRGYESLLRDHSTNWYRDWADKFFGQISLALISNYDVIFETTLRWLEAEAIIRRIDRLEPAREYGFVIEPSAVIVSRDFQSLRCDRCHRQEAALAENHFAEGAPCIRIGCHGTLRKSQPTRSEFAASLLASDRNHRIVAREHTGILGADDRRALEIGFIRDEMSWAPNLISATPTLEMGIDIGDLSTVLLCSVPPEEANYVQRIGRSGRRDGNSLNVTIATARTHDLQFWEEPDSMLSGKVRPPGVYVGALSVLLRQVVAFTLDCFVATGGMSDDYGKVRDVLRKLEDGRVNTFPLDWFHFLEQSGVELARHFIGLLPPEIGARPEIAERVTAYLTGRDHRSLIWHIRSVFDGAARERENLIALRRELDAEARRVRRRQAEMTPEKFEERLNEIKRDKGEINHAIREGIDDVQVLRFLTDKGLLPNYAFPEEGIKLKSILARQPENGRREENGDNLVTHEYVRPASSALTEFAPGQTFYANGREVVIDRLDLNRQDLSKWRFCQACSHVELEATASEMSSCPRCGDDMWDDTGSAHETVELKTVIAVTKEQQAAIRDTDDRQQKQYDRTMVPFYGADQIETSWFADGGNTSTPFGFEFVAPVVFRDFNFGIRAAGPVGARIAGQDRSSHPFRICRHCGIVQHPPRGDDDAGQHQPRCQVLRNEEEIPRTTWEAQVFLMRKFETEAIRMVVPVVGEASDDDIKSFVAAINLGMRKHFAGKVDHIRSAVVEAQLDGLATVRSLFLYDAVPGGSGYLRQIAEHPDTMRAVVDSAAEALRNCPCNQRGKSGCFRCVKSYRTQFGPGEPDRDTALQMMEDILSKWGNLTRTSAGIDSRIRDFLVESQLEARFLEKLEAVFGTGCLRPQVLEGGRKGFLLRIGDGERSRFWTIETQVQINRRFRDVPVKRVDFMLSPVGRTRAKPIVVEMDGLKTHATTVADDLTTRLLLIRSGHVRVWTLGWHDLDSDRESTIPNPIAETRLGPAFSGLIAKVLSTAGRADLVEVIALVQRSTSVESLLRHVIDPEINLVSAVSILTRTIISRGRPLEELPRIAKVSEDGRLFLEEGDMFGHAGDGTLDLYLAAGKRSPQVWAEENDDCRILLRGTLPDVAGDPGATPGYSEAWRGLWRIVNLFQDVPGFHVEFEGLETLSAPDLRAFGAGARDGAWLEAIALVDDAFRPLLQALEAAEVPPPDLIGADLSHEGQVVGMIEFGWSGSGVAVCEDKFDVPNWDLISYSPDDFGSLAGLVTTLVQKLEEKAA